MNYETFDDELFIRNTPPGAVNEGVYSTMSGTRLEISIFYRIDGGDKRRVDIGYEMKYAHDVLATESLSEDVWV